MCAGSPRSLLAKKKRYGPMTLIDGTCEFSQTHRSPCKLLTERHLCASDIHLGITMIVDACLSSCATLRHSPIVLRHAPSHAASLSSPARHHALTTACLKPIGASIRVAMLRARRSWRLGTDRAHR